MGPRLAALSCLAAVLVGLQAAPTPARYRSGGAPRLAPMAVGGGEVLLELAVDDSGGVTAVKTLRDTPPYTDFVVSTVRGWRFDPARLDEETPVASSVLVAAIYRAPTLLTPTLGEPPRNPGRPSNDVPFPLSTVTPGFPPQAVGGGVVRVEVALDDTGAVVSASSIDKVPPFDAVAVDAAKRWRFRPGRLSGRRAPAYAYLIFGFPQPITGR